MGSACRTRRHTRVVPVVMAPLRRIGTTPYGQLAGMSAAVAISNLSRMAILFATSLLIARALGVADFGRWTLCTAWAGVLTMVVDFGSSCASNSRPARSGIRITAKNAGSTPMLTMRS